MLQTFLGWLNKPFSAWLKKTFSVRLLCKALDFQTLKCCCSLSILFPGVKGVIQGEKLPFVYTFRSNKWLQLCYILAKKRILNNMKHACFFLPTRNWQWAFFKEDSSVFLPLSPNSSSLTHRLLLHFVFDVGFWHVGIFCSVIGFLTDSNDCYCLRLHVQSLSD